MALDLERGNRLELSWLSGKVVELGKKLGVPTPTHSLMYAMLKPLCDGGGGIASEPTPLTAPYTPFTGLLPSSWRR